ncbi:MAG: tetratricopeptide repeat protein [Rhodospirillales bacterium]|nr:tetratricopeptide repeat protein [Rhodospirillales bacterium]
MNTQHLTRTAALTRATLAVAVLLAVPLATPIARAQGTAPQETLPPGTKSLGTISQPVNAQPTDVWGDFLAGHHAEAVGDGPKALEFYAAAARKGLTSTADLYSRMYILGLTEGRLDGALVALDQAEKLGGKAPLTQLTRAVQALHDGNFETAETLLKEDAGGISQILSPVLIAWSQVGRKNTAGALDSLNKMTATNKDGETTPLQLLHTALIFDLAGKTKEAGEQFSQLQNSAGLSVRSAELWGQHLERQGREQDARKAYEALGDDAERLILSEALQARLKSKTRPPIDVDTAQKGAAEALYGIASAMLAQNAWESALALANMATRLRPDFAPAAMVAAAAFQQNKRLTDANALYAAIPARSPFSWLARLHLADNLDRMDKTDEAVNILTKMAKERPTLAHPLIQLGDVQRRHKEFKQAAESYTLALKRIATPGESEWGIFYSRGVAYEQDKQWPKAEADFLRALELSPEQPAVLNYLGYLWIDEGQHLDRALGMIAKAVEMRPRDGAIVDSLGWGLYRTGDFPGAVKQLERAVMLSPADAVINDHLGDALWQVGRVREARYQWERALIMKPDPELAQAIAEKLKSGLVAAKP